MMTSDHDPILRKLVSWAAARDGVRAVILTSTQANPGAPTDEFSDYDVIIVVRDIREYLQDGWLSDFGNVLTVYRDPVSPFCGYDKFIRVTQYDDGLKIDFTVWPVELLEHVATLEKLPSYLDDGCQVLIDKVGLTTGMACPTFTVFLPTPPSEEEYAAAIENFFSNASYVAKQICREDYLCTIVTLDQQMKLFRLRQMLEWRVGAATGWREKTGLHGKGLQRRLDLATRRDLADTWTGPSKMDRWEALFRTIALYRRAAREVAVELEFTYPQDLDDRVIAYLEGVKTRDVDQ